MPAKGMHTTKGMLREGDPVIDRQNKISGVVLNIGTKYVTVDRGGDGLFSGQAGHVSYDKERVAKGELLEVVK